MHVVLLSNPLVLHVYQQRPSSIEMYSFEKEINPAIPGSVNQVYLEFEKWFSWLLSLLHLTSYNPITGIIFYLVPSLALCSNLLVVSCFQCSCKWQVI